MAATLLTSEQPSTTRTISGVIETIVRVADSRIAYVATALAAVSLFWLAARLPMADLPQHVAQIALWHDLLMEQSLWSELFQINILTPYLLAYSLALALSFIVTASIAFKILLSVAYVAFLASCIQLRRDFGADKRLDWIFIPSFFGFAYDWGFATFLIATPVCLQFIRLARRNAMAPNVKRDAGLVLLGTGLLVSHGLLFLFAGLVGGALLLAARPSIRTFIKGAVPYALLAIICLAFVWATRQTEAPASISGVIWPPLAERLTRFWLYLHSASSHRMIPFTLAMLAAIVLIRPKFNLNAAVPLSVALLIYLLAPHEAYGTASLYQRFGMFILPFAVFACGPSTEAPSNRSGLCQIAVMWACWGIIAIHAQRTLGFAKETADFETVLAAAEPGRRVASISANPTSAATDYSWANLHQASWYQVEKKGLVEFNFAFFHPMVVRYKFSKIPYNGFGFDGGIVGFDWSLPQARIYDYYFIHQLGDALPVEFTTNPACDVRLVKAAGTWSLFERGQCKP
jgi:hypothetical protein